jgi:3,4-dihydroxy 2-butanone 4-phosphate synthase/GTP cyclohydrolase II
VPVITIAALAEWLDAADRAAAATAAPTEGTTR